MFALLCRLHRLLYRDKRVKISPTQLPLAGRHSLEQVEIADFAA